MRKYASLEVLEAWRQAAPGDASARHRIVKAAHRVAFDYDPRPGYLYVRSRMISSRTNDNHDTFPGEEIEKGYRSFLGKPVFVNHHNANHRRSRGVIVAVALHRDANRDGTPDTWVEGLMEVDAVRFPKLAKAILAGRVNRTSMGVDVDWSTCSACGNKATSPAEYCRHLPAMKGKKIRQRNKATGKVEEKLIHEVCAGLSFFENSLLVEDPADPTAAVLDVPDARGLKGLDMFPRTARADRRDGHVTDAVPVGDPLESELASPRMASAYRYQGQKFVFDDPDVGVGELDSRVAYARQAAPLSYHVGRVDRAGTQEPVDRVHADLEVARVADHQGRRNRSSQQLPPVAMGADARAPRVRQGEARVTGVEGAARPRATEPRTGTEIDRGDVPLYLRDRANEASVQFRPADHRVHSSRTAATGDPDFRDHYGNTCRNCGDPVFWLKGSSRTPPRFRHERDIGPTEYDHPADPADPSDKSGRMSPTTFGGTHCAVCGEDVKVNLRALDINGGWHHHDGMKRDHPAVPMHPQDVYDNVPRVRAAYDQARSKMRDHLHSQFEQLEGRPLPRGPRGDEDQMPPDPFTAARKKPQQRWPRPVKGYGGEPRFDGVSLKQDGRGYYVHTHRARSQSYGHPDDIPAADVDYIRSTGARKEGGDHPWFMNHPVAAHHVTAAYNDSSDDERALGDRWYSDAHHIAKIIGKGDSALGAGLLSAYSPRTLWPVNMFNASRAAQGDPPGPGSGALGDHQRKAIRILGGEHHSKVLTAPKTAAFAHLIEHGGDSPEDVKSGHQRVVIDRHAMSVATGRRLTDADTDEMPVGQEQHYEHVSNAYREAARTLSGQHGRQISPHQVQAATWLRQIRKNTEEDASGSMGGSGKGRVQMGDNSRRRWVEHHHEHHPGHVPEENMHYHGSIDQPGGTNCVNCGRELGSTGAPRSRLAPFLCQGCLGRIGWKEDSALPGYMDEARARGVVEGPHSRPYRDSDLFRHSQSALAKTAYGETRMPPQVDTLRMDECPVCGEHNVWSGSRCPVCGFVVPPSVFRDPDTDKAKEVREQLDDTGEVDVPPDAPDQGQPDASLPAAQVGSGDDADGQLIHPDQIAPDGVPTVQGGEGGPEGFDGQPPQDEGAEQDEVPEGDVPPDEAELEDTGDEGEEMFAEELICPACGTTFEADAAAQPGVPCPACGMAALHPVDEEGPDEGEGDEEGEEDGAVPPEGAEDPSDPDEEPGDEEDEEDEDRDMPASKTAAALAQAQARRIAELSAQNEVLSAQLRFLASAAGIDRELAEVGRRVMHRHADILNPASPVPDPPEAPPTQTTEQALQPESMDNAGRPGTTPGANSRVPAQQTTTAITPGVEMQTPPATNLIDVTAPVQGTNPSQDGGVPLEQRRIETDVRVDPDPLKAHGPGIGGQGDNGSAFPWILDAQSPAQGGQPAQQGQAKAASLNEGAASRRTFASIRLAKLRVLAGLAQGEELAVAERIEHDASLATPVIEHEIGVLSRMPVIDQRQAARPVQRTAARSVPSLASVGASSAYAPAVTDDLDASDLFY